MLNNNRKWLVIILALVFAMTMFAGCGGKTTDTDKGEDVGSITIGGDGKIPAAFREKDLNEGWPSADLPPGFPKYPNGDLYYEADDLGVFLCVLETDRETYDGYLESLEAAGFIFDPEEDGTYCAVQKTWQLSITFYDDEGAVCLMVIDMGFDLEDDFVSDEWPAEVPDYTDGNVDFVSGSGNDTIMITISNTSKAALEKYFDVLAKDGWESTDSNDIYYNFFDKGNKSLAILLDDDGTTLSITLLEVSPSTTLPSVWPTAELPSGFPEYPGGNVTFASKTGDDIIYVIVSGTDEKTLDAYKVTLEKAGWSFEEKTSAGFWNGKKDGKSISLSFGKNDNTANIMVI